MVPILGLPVSSILFMDTIFNYTTQIDGSGVEEAENVKNLPLD